MLDIVVGLFVNSLCLWTSGVKAWRMMPHDLRALLWLLQGRAKQPSGAIFDSRTLQSTPKSGTRAAYDGAKHRVVERSFAWTGRFRRLAHDYERLAQALAGMHVVAFAILMLKRFVELST